MNPVTILILGRICLVHCLVQSGCWNALQRVRHGQIFTKQNYLTWFNRISYVSTRASTFLTCNLDWLCRHQSSAAMSLKYSFFWDAVRHRLVVGNKLSGQHVSLWDRVVMLSRNVGNQLPNYAAQCSRRVRLHVEWSFFLRLYEVLFGPSRCIQRWYWEYAA
jgi:hypothetical protein